MAAPLIKVPAAIIADPRRPVPIFVIEEVLRAYNPKEIKLRMAKGERRPGNLILDTWFDHIPNNLEESIKSIAGLSKAGCSYTMTCISFHKTLIIQTFSNTPEKYSLLAFV